MSITGQEGDPPTRTGNAYGDILGGMNLTIGILTALHARELTGEGQFVDVSLVDSVVASLEQAWQRFFVQGFVPTRHGNYYDAIAPYDTFLAKDGEMVIACGNQKLFERFCNNHLQHPEYITDERFLTVPLRVQNNKIFKAFVEEWLQDKTIAETTNELLADGIPAGPVMNIEQIANDEHIAGARQMFVDVEHPVCGTVKLNGTPIKLSDTKGEIRFAAPTLGQHNEEVLMGLGYSKEQIAQFREEKVI